MNHQERWAHTRQCDEWTPEVSEHTQTWLDTRTRHMHEQHRQAIRADNAEAKANCVMMLNTYTQIQKEIFDREQASHQQHHRNHHEWYERNQYSRTPNSMWADVLRWARTGELPSHWRDLLPGYHARCMKRAHPHLTAEVDGLALHELTTLPPQPWEPYVADGDWRGALDAWYRETLALHDRTRQQRAEERATEPRRSRLLDADQAAVAACRDADIEAIEAINHARGRDKIEAWYRAGLAAGGVDEDWAGWYRGRITTWDRRHDTIYRIGLITAEHELEHFGQVTGAAAAGGWHQMPMHELPDHWTAGAPALNH